MNFDIFLQSLTKVAEWKYGNGDKVQSLHALINEHLMPLFDHIDAQNKFVNKELHFEI
jgi:hypothetical protein